MPVEITRQGDGKLVCKFLGRMDTAHCMETEKKVIESIESASKVIYDLEGVDYIASAFLRLCIKTSQTVNQGNFSIINVTPVIKKVFKIAGLAEELNLEA